MQYDVINSSNCVGGPEIITLCHPRHPNTRTLRGDNARIDSARSREIHSKGGCDPTEHGHLLVEQQQFIQFGKRTHTIHSAGECFYAHHLPHHFARASGESGLQCRKRICMQNSTGGV